MILQKKYNALKNGEGQSQMNRWNDVLKETEHIRTRVEQLEKIAKEEILNEKF